MMSTRVSMKHSIAVLAIGLGIGIGIGYSVKALCVETEEPVVMTDAQALMMCDDIGQVYDYEAVGNTAMELCYIPNSEGERDG